MEENLENLAAKISMTEFKPTEGHASQSDSIRATISAMKRHEVDVFSIHSTIKEFIEFIDDEGSVSDNGNSILMGMAQEKEALERDIASLTESGESEELYFLRQVRFTVDQEIVQ